jgi:hypothetical protein
LSSRGAHIIASALAAHAAPINKSSARILSSSSSHFLQKLLLPNAAHATVVVKLYNAIKTLFLFGLNTLTEG